MGNCLVKEFKGTFQNDNLPYYGCIKLHVKQMTTSAIGQSTLRIVAPAGTLIKTLDGGNHLYLSSSTIVDTPSPLVSQITVDAAGTRILYLDPGASYDVIMGNKYAVSIFEMDNNTAPQRNFGYEIEDVAYSTELTSLYVAHASDVKGDIASVAALTKLTKLVLQDCSVTGDVKNLKNLTALTILNLQSLGIYGELKPLFDNIAALHVSRTLDLRANEDVTINGVATMWLPKTVTFPGDGTWSVS